MQYSEEEVDIPRTVGKGTGLQYNVPSVLCTKKGQPLPFSIVQYLNIILS